MKLRTVAMTGMMSLAGLGLIGVGAHATFDTSTTSNQIVASGAPGVTLSGSCYGASCAAGANYSTSDNGQTLTFSPGGPYGSTFTTGDEMVTATNTGNIPLSELNFTVNTTYPGSALATEAYVCIGSTGLDTGGSFFPIYNGPLAAENGASYGQNGSILTVAGSTPNGFVYPTPGATGPTDNYIVDVYAGNVTTACGSSSAPALDSSAESQSITISVTLTYQG